MCSIQFVQLKPEGRVEFGSVSNGGGMDISNTWLVGWTAGGERCDFKPLLDQLGCRWQIDSLHARDEIQHAASALAIAEAAPAIPVEAHMELRGVVALMNRAWPAQAVATTP